MVVMAIVGLIVGITYPSVSNGLESVRLSSAADSVASFLNAAANRAERRQEAIQLTVAVPENSIVIRSTEAGYERKLELPEGITVQSAVPPQSLLLPGGTPPRVAIELANRRGSHRIVRLDPLTGVPHIEAPVEKEP